MGIRLLNRFLQSNCKTSIQKIGLWDLSNKKIVIDANIYMYKYLGENALLENMYLMICILKQYNIVPLFVFDGKPPKEKENLLKERKNNKTIAENEYNILKDNLNDTNDEEQNQLIKSNMISLKKKFIRLHHTDIQHVKKLLQCLGVSYIVAPGEADKLCASIVNNNFAYACLSEDMDLFVYGCKRVLRYLSLVNKNIIIYHLKQILNEIDMNFIDFKNICIISGTDYNIVNNNSLTRTINDFKKYKNYLINDTNNITFLKWMGDNVDYVNINEINEINELFSLDDTCELKYYLKNQIVNNSNLNISCLKTLLKREHFIFIN
jgi:flap endonuclease-1